MCCSVLLVVCACDDITDVEPVDPEFGTNHFHSREHETALGSMVCDAIVWDINENRAGGFEPVDFGVLNGGIFEYGLRKGPISADMIPGMIKGDTLTIVELPGEEVVELFEWLVALRLGENAWAQVSEEVNYTIDWTNGKGQLRNLTIKGIELDFDQNPALKDRIYRLCTGDVLVYGKPNSHIDRFYPVLNRHKEEVDRTGDTGKTVADAVYDFVASRPQPYIPHIDGRIKIEK
jgi:5'-nucleotidase/UDP-sugar diphosphatase